MNEEEQVRLQAHDPQWWMDTDLMYQTRCEKGYYQTNDRAHFVCQNLGKWHLHRDIWLKAHQYSGLPEMVNGKDGELSLFANLCEEHYREWVKPNHPEMDALHELMREVGLGE